MPRPGAKSKPTKLKVLQGNPGKRKLSDKEPDPTPVEKIPDPPHWLDYYAKKEWKRVAEKLIEIGLLTEIDLSTFTIYCQRYAEWIRAEKAIMKKGMTFLTPKGFVQQRPEVAIARDTAKQLRMYAEVLGLAPAARSGLEIKRDDEGPSVEDILNGKTG